MAYPWLGGVPGTNDPMSLVRMLQAREGHGAYHGYGGQGTRVPVTADLLARFFPGQPAAIAAPTPEAEFQGLGLWNSPNVNIGPGRTATTNPLTDAQGLSRLWSAQAGPALPSHAMDNQGLSALWSRMQGQTVSPGGWNTTTYGAQSPIGGLLGRIFG